MNDTRSIIYKGITYKGGIYRVLKVLAPLRFSSTETCSVKGFQHNMVLSLFLAENMDCIGTLHLSVLKIEKGILTIQSTYRF